MPIANSTSRYGTISQGIHWVTALLVVLLLLSGKVGEIEAKDSNALYYWHSSLGLTILLLVIARVIWRIVSPPPPFPPAMSTPARRIARASHVLFYALLVAVPLSGWLASSAEGGKVTFFGIATLPNAFASSAVASQPAADTGAHEDRRASEQEGDDVWEETHETLGNALLIVAILHMLAAFKHHFVDKDDILRRMLPRGPVP